MNADDAMKLTQGKAVEVFFDVFFRPIWEEVLSRIELNGNMSETELRESLKVALVLRTDLPRHKDAVQDLINETVETALEKGSRRGHFSLKGKEGLRKWFAAAEATCLGKPL